MNVLKAVFPFVIIVLSLSFFLIGGWGIIAVFYAIAYLIVVLNNFIKSRVKTENMSYQLAKLSDLICDKEMITQEEFNNMKKQVFGIKL